MESGVPPAEKALRQRNADVQVWPAAVRPRRESQHCRGYYSDLGTWHMLGTAIFSQQQLVQHVGGLVVWKDVLAAVRVVEVPTGNLSEGSWERENEGHLLAVAFI